MVRLIQNLLRFEMGRKVLLNSRWKLLMFLSFLIPYLLKRNREF